MSGFVLGFVFYLSHVTSIPAGDLQKKGILGISDYYRCASIFESLKTACFAPRYRYEFHRYMLRIGAGEIGRASCRERVCQYVEISVVADASNKKTNTRHTTP